LRVEEYEYEYKESEDSTAAETLRDLSLDPRNQTTVPENNQHQGQSISETQSYSSDSYVDGSSVSAITRDMAAISLDTSRKSKEADGSYTGKS